MIQINMKDNSTAILIKSSIKYNTALKMFYSEKKQKTTKKHNAVNLDLHIFINTIQNFFHE